MNPDTTTIHSGSPVYSPALQQYPSATPAIHEQQPLLFIATQAHEIRNPLTNISLAVEMLKRLVKEDAPQFYLDTIMRASLRVNELVSELISFGHTEAARSEDHSVHQLLDEVLILAADRIALKNITVCKQYASYEDQRLFNKPKMKIALTNIIINAIDAMEGKNGQLRISTTTVNDKCVLKIEDNGCGISNENLQLIFTPYFTRKKNGLGIGLSATLAILKANKVKVEVESEEGRGTRFILSFPKTHFSFKRNLQ